jgi:Family of unknown function (DUF5302)
MAAVASVTGAKLALMSNSAQDDDAVATTTAGAEATSEAAETVEASAQAADASAPATRSDETAPVADLDETKRKFREALERKHQASTKEAGAAGGRGTVKGKGAQGPATSRRSFRRKSG